MSSQRVVLLVAMDDDALHALLCDCHHLFLRAAATSALLSSKAAHVYYACGASDEEQRFIAILDIFGFERLETNSLEQLLINHTNERLQLYFLQNTLQVGAPTCSYRYSKIACATELWHAFRCHLSV